MRSCGWPGSSTTTGTATRPTSGGGHGGCHRTCGAPCSCANRHCRFPGCHRTRHLHAHHVLHWARGGPTDLANLLLVCAFHHRVIHRQQWTMRPLDPPAGRWTFHAPDHDDPHPPVLPLPGAPAEAATDLVEAPHPRSLQPPWWDGNAYDLNETIAVVVDALRDIRPPKVDRRPHPAMAAQAA